MANLQRIKDLAELKNISIRDLAERVGVKENQIHVMCRTNSTKIDTLEKIASVLRVSVKVFFDDDVTFREEYHAHGEKGMAVRNIELVDQRTTANPETSQPHSQGESVEVILRDQISQLKSQLADKERIIKLMEGKK